MRFSLWIVLLLAGPALAEDWRVLSSEEIRSALSARVLQYADGASQNFFTDGRTLYQAGAGESWGKWWVEADQYCSTWPPSEVPSCYGVAAQGPDIRFTGASGDVTVGRYGDL
ncbi:MAG TPA: hypothetical protein PKA03_09760 [Tabrizicola sp.]|nr:hypothetical protein [Tabrizicola sp.]HMS95489.1 hypothetical protein [Tabrizicola sp.]